jgi:hypothetical protein
VSFWDEVAETAEGLVTDPVDTVSDRVAEAGAAADYVIDQFQEEYGQPDEGTITPAPPQPEGPYDQTGVPTKSELMDFVDGFEPPVRDAMAREFAKELYPGFTAYIDMSKDQWEQEKSAWGDTVTIGGDGWGSETYTAFKWYDEIEMVLPTVEGMNYYRMQDPIGPDPEEMIGEIATAGEARAGVLVGDLRTACEEALRFDDLEGIFHTAKAHAGLYSAFEAAKSDLSLNIGHIEALGAEWTGDDAARFREQYGDYVGEALEMHAAIALNLSRGADSDLGLQVALHFSAAGVLRAGQDRIDALSVRRLFGDNGISVLTAASTIGGIVGLYPVLSAGVAMTIGLSGLAMTAAGLAGGDVKLNPKTDLIPSSEDIREVMTTMTEGIRQITEETAALRTDCASQLRTLSADHMNSIGSCELVPGSGY